jgi:hypothetical protein
MNTLVLSLLAAAVSASTPASFQQIESWSAWRGCWQAEGAPPNEIVCISLADGGVRISTLVAGAVREESRITADGLGRAIRSDGCTGTERARWSSDGSRVFLTSELTCGPTRRTVRGMFAFVAPDEWISVQTATEGDSIATRMVRFLAVEPERLPAAATSFASRYAFSDALLTVDDSDVSEAVEQIGALAAQEWMRAAGEPFEVGYANQNRAAGSALEQVGRLSNPVVVSEVVRVVERPVYVHTTYVTDRYYRYYSPWGHYHHYGWRWYHRPLVVVRLPILIHRNHNYHRDYWRYDRDRYDRDRYDRYDRDRYDRDRSHRDRDHDGRGGRVTRGGYANGGQRTSAENATPNRARIENRSAPPPAATRQAVGRAPRASAPPQRTSTPARGVVTRTAKARSNTRD